MPREGATVLPAAAAGAGGAPSAGPGSKRAGTPFYNPAMAVNRDLSVLAVEAWARRRGRPIDVGDALAGAGVRSLRLAHEVDADLVVHANDGDPACHAAIADGMQANAVGEARLRTTTGSAAAFLAARRFDVVDLDPYGSPAPLLDAAVRATRHDGLVCVTATDTAALCGRYPRVCRRRYAAEPMHRALWRAEVGLRILAGAVVRSAGRHERGAGPVLSVAYGHWMRVIAHVRDRGAAADRAARALGHVVLDEETGNGSFSDAGAGPLWTGPLHDPALLAALRPEMHEMHAATGPLVATLAAEARAPAFWIEPLDVQSRLGRERAPRRTRLLAALADAGAVVAPSHISGQGIRTDADAAVLRRCWDGCTTKAE